MGLHSGSDLEPDSPLLARAISEGGRIRRIPPTTTDSRSEGPRHRNVHFRESHGAVPL